MKKYCSHSLSIPILYLAKMHLANFYYWRNNYVQFQSLIFFNYNFLLNCLPLHCSKFYSSQVALRELDQERKFIFSMCETRQFSMQKHQNLLLKAQNVMLDI